MQDNLWMIMRSDNINEILDWLIPRMRELEKVAMLRELGLENIAGLIKCWAIPEIKERLKLEVQKRATASDCSFKLEESTPEPVVKVTKRKKYYPHRTHVDMTSKDD